MKSAEHLLSRTELEGLAEIKRADEIQCRGTDS